MTQLRNIRASSPQPDDERPLTARSVVASTLLGTQPPVLPAWLLVRAGELFGIAPGATRVALSRMAAAGEVEAEDGRYRLAGPLLARQASQETARRPRLRRWDGAWRVAVVTAEEARAPADRARLRAAMAELGLAELREGVWLRPDNLTTAHTSTAAGRVVDAQCTWLTGWPADDEHSLAGRLWDLSGWARRGEELRGRMRALLAPLEGGDTGALAPGFVLSAAVLRHLRRDPLLPDRLLPDGWPGAALRTEYDVFDAAYQRLLRDWFRQQRAGAT